MTMILTVGRLMSLLLFSIIAHSVHQRHLVRNWQDVHSMMMMMTMVILSNPSVQSKSHRLLNFERHIPPPPPTAVVDVDCRCSSSFYTRMVTDILQTVSGPVW